MNSDQYGPLGKTVAAAGCIMSATVALILAFRGRAAWEPSEQDIPTGPERVAAVLTAVLIVIIWATMSSPALRPRLARLAVRSAVGCVAFLLVYGPLVGTLTYDRVLSAAPSVTVTEKIIGGFWLTKDAADAQQKYKVTTQELLKGAGYDPDKVWSRFSRAVAKDCFVVSYIGLVTCGTVALACVSVILSFFLKNKEG